MAEGADHLEAKPLWPGESRSEWDPHTRGLRCIWRECPWRPLQLALLTWLLLQSTTFAAAITYAAAEEWAAGGVPVKGSLGAAAFWAGSVGFALFFIRQIQGRGKPIELHASPDGFLYINPTGLRRRVYIPREYIRDVRAEGHFSSLMFREWRLCIELTTPCVPLNLPRRRYTLWRSQGRTYLEGWATTLRQAMNIRPAGPASRP